MGQADGGRKGREGARELGRGGPLSNDEVPCGAYAAAGCAHLGKRTHARTRSPSQRQAHKALRGTSALRVLGACEAADLLTRFGSLFFFCSVRAWQEGRPSWKPRFSAVAAKHSTGDVGVAFCGNKMIATDLKKQCYLQNQSRTDGFFKLHKVSTRHIACLSAAQGGNPCAADPALLTAALCVLFACSLSRSSCRKISEALASLHRAADSHPHRAWPLHSTHQALTPLFTDRTSAVLSFPFLSFPFPFPIPVNFDSVRFPLFLPFCFSFSLFFLLRRAPSCSLLLAPLATARSDQSSCSRVGLVRFASTPFLLFCSRLFLPFQPEPSYTCWLQSSLDSLSVPLCSSPLARRIVSAGLHLVKSAV